MKSLTYSPTAGALNFSIIYPSLASPGAQPQTWIHRVPALRIPQSLPPSDGWSSLKETWRNKSGYQQDCQIILPWLSHSLGVKIDGGCKQLGGKKLSLEPISSLFPVNLHYLIGEGFLPQKHLAPRYNKTTFKNSVNFRVSQSWWKRELFEKVTVILLRRQLPWLPPKSLGLFLFFGVFFFFAFWQEVFVQGKPGWPKIGWALSPNTLVAARATTHRMGQDGEGLRFKGGR